jgi:hypothetical protein
LFIIYARSMAFSNNETLIFFKSLGQVHLIHQSQLVFPSLWGVVPHS